MAPIHDTDIAEERWSQAEWEHYELWERVEVRLRRRKWYWISGAVAVFLAFAAVPVFMDQTPKWMTLLSTRRLAQEINFIKKEAALSHDAYRIRFLPDKRLGYVVERAGSCSATQWSIVKEGSLMLAPFSSAVEVLLTPEEGNGLGIPGLIDTFCYDDLAGSSAVLQGQSLVGFGIIPSPDLADHRVNRISTLLLKGPSAEISFE